VLSVPVDIPRPPVSLPDHGTCSASKAVGVRLGVAKKANLVVVPIVLTFSDLLVAFRAVLTDIADNMERGKVVLNFSHGGD